MKIGIYLGYAPGIVLGKEGLGKYLGNLVKNFQNRNHQIVIACPQWLLGTLDALWEDLKISSESITYIVEDRIPIVWKWYYSKLEKKHPKKKFRLDYVSLLEWGINKFFSITSVILFGICLLIGLLFAIIFSPVALISAIVYFILHFLVHMKKKSSVWANKLLDRGLRIYEKAGENGLNYYLKIYSYILEKVQKDLVRRINRAKGIDIWYCPALFWPAFSKVHGPRIINAPDLVTEVFAAKWGNRERYTLYSTKQCEKSIEENSDFIVYCNFVKESLLINKFGKNSDNISVIPHIVNDLSGYVTIDEKYTTDVWTKKSMEKQYCRRLLQSLGSHTSRISEYMQGYSFSDVKYIFYASQARVHKNMMNLVKAYEYLLRKKYVRIKLFLTCGLDSLPEVRDYIFARRLQYDIVTLYNVSTKELAALYKEAELVVNPTLYEGGFPFTFGEGMSVGTPSIMSRIPQVLEVVEGYGLEDALFDPYNIYDIADKIKYGLENRDLLFERESELYNELLKNNEEKNGAMYEEAFNKVILRSRNLNH